MKSEAEIRAHVLKEAEEALSWTLDLLDIYDKQMVKMGEPEEKVYAPIHLRAKTKARAALEQVQAELRSLAAQPAAPQDVVDAKRVMECLQVAKQTISEWTRDADGRVTVHPDVIGKAVDAAIFNLAALLPGKE